MADDDNIESFMERRAKVVKETVDGKAGFSLEAPEEVHVVLTALRAWYTQTPAPDNPDALDRDMADMAAFIMARLHDHYRERGSAVSSTVLEAMLLDQQMREALKDD